MKKQLLGAAVTAVLMAGNAQAALPTFAADTTVVYLSGASASLDYIKNLITNSNVPAADRICDSSQEIWTFNDLADNGKTQAAFYCAKASTNTKLANAGSHLLIYKRSEGGSAMGVNPLVANESMTFLNVTSNPTCAQVGTTTTAKCEYDSTLATKSTTAIADFGMSDVDPIQFTGENTPDGFAAITSADLDALTVKGASVVAFGEPVTLQLYKALQAAQLATGQIPATTKAVLAHDSVAVGDTVTCAVGNVKDEGCMPNLTSAQIATIHSGGWSNWNSLKVGSTGLGLSDWISANNPSLSPAASDIHVCRRVNGSGTQAQHNLVFLNYPCAAASSATLAAHDLGTAEGDGFPLVHEMSTSGGVSECLDELNTGTTTGTVFDNSSFVGGVRWAVGIQSMEKKSANFEFVKVDGVAPTLAHIVDGSYKDWVENTFQYNTTRYGSLSAAKKAVVDAVIFSAGLPEVMSSLNGGFTHGFGNGSFLAVPSLFTPEANGAFNSGRPVSPYSRATANAAVENCRVPTIYNGGDSKL